MIQPAWITGTGGDRIEFLAVTATHIYWTSDVPGEPTVAYIGRAAIDGSAVEPHWVKLDAARGFIGVTGIATDGVHLFFGMEEEDEEEEFPTFIGRILLDGTSLEAHWLALPSPFGEVADLAVNESHLYFNLHRFLGAKPYMGRVELSGANLEPALVEAGAGEALLLTPTDVLLCGEAPCRFTCALDGSEPDHVAALLAKRGMATMPGAFTATRLAYLTREREGPTRLIRADLSPLGAHEEAVEVTLCEGDAHCLRTDEAHGYYVSGPDTIGRFAFTDLPAEEEHEEEEEEEEEGGSPVAAITLRERPPTRLSVLVETPGGLSQRWGEDDPNPVFAPTAMDFGSAMPGGFDRFSCVLQRDPSLPYSDLEMLSKITVLGNGGTVAWQGRLEKLPDVAGYQAQITPEAVGEQAALEDDNTAREIYVDKELARWEAMHAQRKINLLGGGFSPSDPTVEGGSEGEQVVSTAVTTPWGTAAAIGEAWYDSAGIPIGLLEFAYKLNGNIGPEDGNWGTLAFLSIDDVASAFDATGASPPKAEFSEILGASTADRVFAGVQQIYTGADASEGVVRAVLWTVLSVMGLHGLPKIGPTPFGLHASDIVAHAISRWVPGMRTAIVSTSFQIEQLAFLEPTTVAEMVKQATRFELPDWAVWEGPTFYMNPRGERARQWKARSGPAQLQGAGPQTSRLWNGVAVQYQDVSGKTRMVGPPGFPGGTPATEDSLLLDSDPENPLNQAAKRKWALLKMGTGTVAGAKAVGQRFLQEQARLETSGQASIVGYVEDTQGGTYPAWAIRAGDEISFVDASDPSPRRIVNVSYSHPTRTATLQLDQPPDSLTAILERLSVVLLPFGFT